MAWIVPIIKLKNGNLQFETVKSTVVSSKIKRNRLFFTLLVFVLLVSGTVLAIKIAKGYRPSFNKLELKGTGLLSVTSYPKSAQVLINDKLTTVTDDTLYLSPSSYQIKIIKNGFQPWTKTIPVKAELVSNTDARLFPAIPSITPITFYQVSKPLISPDNNKVAYVLSGSPFPQDNGLYVLSLSNNFLGNQITQITENSSYDYTKANLLWSPDSSQILALWHDDKKVLASHLLNAKTMNQTKGLTDSSFRLNLILGQWEKQLIEINKNNLLNLPTFMVDVATRSATNVYFSPDKEKVLYTALETLEIPDNLTNKNLPNSNSTPQVRKLEVGKTYVFDVKEFSNYQINQAVYDYQLATKLVTPNQSLDSLISSPTPSPTLKATKASQIKTPSELDLLLKKIAILRGQTDSNSTHNLSWYSTSRHLIVTNTDSIHVIEYDGNNSTLLISAKLSDGFAISTPDGNRLIILSNLNQKPEVFNLLSLDLK